jgi:phage shock protein PspC (stress-responsive transcriptional regulator)
MLSAIIHPGGTMTSFTEHTTAQPDEAPSRRLVRSRDGRWLGGVSAGLGRYFDVNPLVYRIAFAALALAGGTGLVLYLAAWLVIPHEDAEDSIAAESLREHRDRPWLLLGVGLLGLGAVLVLSEASIWPGPGNVWLAATLAGAAIVWWHVAGKGIGQGAQASPVEPRSRARRPSLLLPVAGLLLAAAGFVGLLDVLGAFDVDGRIAFALATGLVGAAVVGGALTGRRVGGLVLLGAVLLVGFAAAALSPVSVSSGIGERDVHPLTAAELRPSYDLGIGELTVDLGAVRLEPGRTKVEVRLGIGELVVVVPEGAALEIDAHAGAGNIEVLGRTDDGAGADTRVVVPGPSATAPVLVVDAHVGLGDLQVRTG